MEFSFSKPDFKSGLRATGLMMTGNASVAFLIFDNSNGESLAYLLVCGLSLLYFLHLLASHLTKELKMNDVHIVIGCFTVLMCAMSLVASYFEAKEKSKAEPRDANI